MEAIFAILLLVAAWAGYSAIGIAYPVELFSTRGRAVMSFGLSAATFLIVGGFALSVVSPSYLSDTGEPGAAQAAGSDHDSALIAQARLRGDIPDPCGNGGVALRDVVAVIGNHLIRASADASAPKLKNEKASRALGKVHFHQIDNSTTVRRLCVQEAWTEIQIITPNWLTHVRGWVPNEALREIERSGDGVRVHVEGDFLWDNDTSVFKPQIVAIVNKITRENKNCSVIDTYSLAKSPSRSKPGDPVFFVTCGTDANLFNVWFRPTDVEEGQKFMAREPLGKEAAVAACEAAAQAIATHPSTVNFSKIWDLAYLPHVSGRARVVSSFTAKNSLNLRLKYRIDCLFDGATLIETQVEEKND